MFPNLLCGVYMYFDRSKELRTYCAQFWRSPSQLQMEVFKAMVIAGYSCLRKEPGTGVGVIDIFFFKQKLGHMERTFVQLTCGGYLLCLRPMLCSN